MIEKPSILITSIGRTGTEFFSKFFEDILEDCTSLHEPDIFKYQGVDNKIEQYGNQIRLIGIWRGLILKPLGKWTLARLSDARFLNKLDFNQAYMELLFQRKSFVAKMPGSIYVESNLGYYGLLDVTPNVFENHRAIYVVRDGRNWVRSALNWGEVYGKRGIRKFFAHKWPTPHNIPDDPYKERWDSLSRFEQLCWVWANLNKFALNLMRKNPYAKVFQFEKIFSGKDRYKYLNELITFAISLSNIDSKSIKQSDGWLERKIHMSSSEFPTWDNWTSDQKKQFDHICGSLMAELGYEY